MDHLPQHYGIDSKMNTLINVREAKGRVTDAEMALENHVRAARQAGASWAEIAEVIGVTRQAAQQRFGR